MASMLRKAMPRFLQRFIDRQARRVGRWMLREDIEALRAEIAPILPAASLLTDKAVISLRAEMQEHLADVHAETERLRLQIQSANDSAQAMFRILDQANKRIEADALAGGASVGIDDPNPPGLRTESDRPDQ